MSEQDFSKYDVGQGVILDGYFDENLSSEKGLIVQVFNDAIGIVPVYYIRNEMVLYDMSDKPEYKDNVPLRSCPPPFSNDVGLGVYAVADMSCVAKLSFAEFYQYAVKSSDNFQSISDHDLSLVFDHDRRVMQREYDFGFLDCGSNKEDGYDFT